MPRSNDVMAAFKILLEEIDAEVAGLNEEGARTIRSGDYDTTQQIAGRAKWVAAFRKRVEDLQKQWDQWCREQMPTFPRQEGSSTTTAELVTGRRLQSGGSTPADAFRRAILEALVEHGGSAPCREVLQRVYERMENRLSAHDREPIRSDPNEPRWRKNAHWCRLRLVHDGLLVHDSQRGIWKITERGRQELARLCELEGAAKEESE